MSHRLELQPTLSGDRLTIAPTDWGKCGGCGRAMEKIGGVLCEGTQMRQGSDLSQVIYALKKP